MDKELDGISFVATYRQYYEIELPVEIIKNRNTQNMPCSSGEEKFDEKRNRVALNRMMSDAGCVVPFIERNENDTEICRNKKDARIAHKIYEGDGIYYDLYGRKNIALPCKQMHVVPRQSFTSPEWNNQTWISALFMKISKVTEQQQAYSMLSFFAEVGGTVGLLLGVSVYQLRMLFDLIPHKFLFLISI